MTNEFDKLLRETFEGIVMKARGTAILPFGLNYEVIASLFTANPVITLERRIDFAKIVIDEREVTQVLHVEFQTNNEKRMVVRMQTYRALIHEWHSLPIKQYVIYLGETPATMPTHIQELIPNDPIDYHFELIEIRKFDAHALLVSDIPEIILLAILGSRGGTDPYDLAVKIINRLKAVCHSRAALDKYIAQLQTISKLRNLDKLFIERRDDMALDTGISMMDVAWYRDAFTSGEQKGATKKAKQAALKMLQKGSYPDEEIIDIQGLTQKELEELKRQVNQ